MSCAEVYVHSGGEPLDDPKSEPVLRHLPSEPLVLSLTQSDAFQVRVLQWLFVSLPHLFSFSEFCAKNSNKSFLFGHTAFLLSGFTGGPPATQLRHRRHHKWGKTCLSWRQRRPPQVKQTFPIKQKSLKSTSRTLLRSGELQWFAARKLAARGFAAAGAT